jgi:hypothetical protein
MTHDTREETCLHRPCRKARRILADGPAPTFPSGDALRILGLREQIHPDDVYAWLYTTSEDAKALLAANKAHYGHPGWVVPVEGGFVQVVDFRPALAESDCPLTDPALPDR